MFDYRARLIEVLDGDTVRLEIDQGLGGRQQEDIRLEGVDAPERKDPGWAQAKEFTAVWLGLCDKRLSWPLYVKTLPNRTPEPRERRTFARYVGTVWDIGQPDAPSLNAALTEYLTRPEVTP